MTWLADTWHIYTHQMRVALRQPIWLVVSLAQPLIWLLLYGQLFKNMASLPGFPTGSYLQFFAPGVVVMTALFGSGFAGMAILHDLDFGIIDKQLVTPAAPTAILLGRVLQASTTAAVQSMLVLVLAWALGASLAGGITGALVVFLTAGLLGTAVSAISHGMAIILRREEPLIALLNFLLMPLMFLSTAMMPAEFAPGWIGQVARFNPVNWSVNTVRTVVLHGVQWSEVGLNLVLLAAFAIAATLLATTAFRAKAE